VSIQTLPADALNRRCEPSSLGFDTTDHVEPLEEPLGQERAVRALDLAISMRHPGYHAYAMGPSAMGKRTLVERTLEARARTQPVPSDWLYLHDFDAPHHPRAVELPAGTGARFHRDIDRLIEELKAAIPAAFESDEYRARLQSIHKQLGEERERAMSALARKAEARSIAIVRTPVGLAMAPVRGGEVIEPETFKELPKEEQARIERDVQELQEELGALLRTFPSQERKHREQVKEMNRDVTRRAVEHLIAELVDRYASHPALVAQLEAIQSDVVDNVREFLGSAEGDDSVAAQMRKLFSEAPAFRRYQVNVLVDNSKLTGAPVVFEDLPTHSALVGRMDHEAHFGALVTDFTQLRAGALHRANGGYLVLDARRVLTQPLAWEELKRALRSNLVRIEPTERRFGMSGGASLEPRAIPLDVKVILLGDRMLYFLLCELDPEFSDLFKVVADFEEELARDSEGEQRFARLVAKLVAEEKLPPFGVDAVARVIEESARWASDRDKLSIRIDAVADLLRESAHLARASSPSQGPRDKSLSSSAVAGGEGPLHAPAVVRAEHVQQAIDDRIQRSDRVRRRAHEAIRNGVIHVDTDGAQIGQVNGLSVISLGALSFGQPSRITARVRLGRGEVVDIEREVELGGPLHSKGVLILSSFLGATFASDRPLSLSASLVFEQSYGGVEGDSASCAELCALLSALAEVPVKQSLAITGSVDQHGRAQAIGGVNEKIEGFFELCQARGLTGKQGVIIPRSNERHLALRPSVVSAVREGRFHVWSIDTVAEAAELLMGLPFGERGPDGAFAPETLGAKVSARLETLLEAAQRFAQRDKSDPRA
jgi:lon-related putative ATP-dependent protease